MPDFKKYKLKTKSAVRKMVPDGVVRRFKILKQGEKYVPPIGKIDFGDFRRLKPMSDDFGFARGGSIARQYIEKFLTNHSADIKGAVLEVGDNKYTMAYGKNRVTKSDILDVNEGNPKATIVADLTNADHLPSNMYDCVILTNVISMIFDYDSAFRTIYRILKPSGVLLLTSGVGFKLHRNPNCEIHWNISDLCLRKILVEFFRGEKITTERYGNILTFMCFLFGIGRTELDDKEYDFNDDNYPVIFGVRAVKD